AGAEVKWRESKDLPPGRLRLASPYDTDARYGFKQGSWWTGYKIHISESCDETDDQDAAAGRGGRWSRRVAAALDHQHRDHRRHSDRRGND
ncbi:hypothetical protein ABZ339_02530, partial [Streptomyces sp. NPDC005969]